MDPQRQDSGRSNSPTDNHDQDRSGNDLSNAAAGAQTSVDSTASTGAGATLGSPPAGARRDVYWCHQCQAEITPLLVPDPMCPTCHGEFVEKVERDNDPREFTQGGSGPQESGLNDMGPLADIRDYDELVNIISAFMGALPPGSLYMAPPEDQQRSGYTSRYAQHVFEHGPPINTDFFTATMGSTMGSTTGYTLNLPFPPLEQRRAPRTLLSALSGMIFGGGGNRNPAATPGMGPIDGATMPSFLSGLMSRFFQAPNVPTEPGVAGSGPHALPMGFLSMMEGHQAMGNPADYAWGQGGLDDIISQLMEMHGQSRQTGPVGLTEEAIERIPIHKLTNEELESKLECSVCKEEFSKEEKLFKLPCNHIFHEDCIKPWLKVSGTCPTCRFSLVEGADGSSDQGSGSRATGAGAGQDASRGAPSSPTLPGSFPASNNSTSTGNSNTSGPNRGTDSSQRPPILDMD